MHDGNFDEIKDKGFIFYLICCSLNLLKIVFLTLQNEIVETMKILIIEDEKELSKSIVEYLSVENYLCETAWTFQDAMGKIQSYEYDCIVLDITLPDGNGLRILEELKKENKQDGVIIISAKNSLEDKIAGLQIGADDYLTKPFHLAELSARIFSIIRRKQFENANVIQQNEIKTVLETKSILISFC